MQKAAGILSEAMEQQVYKRKRNRTLNTTRLTLLSDMVAVLSIDSRPSSSRCRIENLAMQPNSSHVICHDFII